MATTINFTLGTEGTWIPPSGAAVRLVLGAVAVGGTLLCGPATRAAWAAADSAPGAAIRTPWMAASAAPGAATALPWTRRITPPLQATFRAPWVNRTLPVLHQALRATWRDLSTNPVPFAVRLPWIAASSAAGLPVRLPWASITALGSGPRATWSRAPQLHLASRSRWASSFSAATGLRLPWKTGLLLVAPNLPYAVPPVPRVPPVLSRVNLHFCVPLANDRLRLQLGVNPCPALSPITALIAARSTYMQTHSVSAQRLADLAEVNLDGFELSADDSSFGWTLAAPGRIDVLQQLAPSSGLPARLRITLDGLVWEFIVEGLQRRREFGRYSAQITGRSASALLADPYAPTGYYTNSVPMTAQQIAADALQYTGVGLDWRATDWLVPTGAWSATTTPMGVVRAIADAIGALVQSPRTGDNVIVMPRYPAMPWNWASTTPDVILASLDPVELEGYERADRPNYEGVYVSGQAQGTVLALVKRTGTAPSLIMPMVTDPLITALVAAEQRGGAMLGAQGPQARMTLTLPVLTGTGEPGVIDPGKLVRVDDPEGSWFGLVRSTRVTVAMPRVSQTLVLERHL